MKRVKVFASLCCLAVAVLSVSCATSALWDSADPDLYVRVSKTNVNTNELTARGVYYRVDSATGDIYMQKSQLRKFGDYTIRVLATPITVTLDAVGGTTILCGAILIGEYSSEWSDHVRRNPQNPEPIIFCPDHKDFNRRDPH